MKRTRFIMVGAICLLTVVGAGQEFGTVFAFAKSGAMKRTRKLVVATRGFSTMYGAGLLLRTVFVLTIVAIFG